MFQSTDGTTWMNSTGFTTGGLLHFRWTLLNWFLVLLRRPLVHPKILVLLRRPLVHPKILVLLRRPLVHPKILVLLRRPLSLPFMTTTIRRFNFVSKKALLRIREGPERLLTGPERLLTGPWPVRQEVIRHLVEPERPVASRATMVQWRNGTKAIPRWRTERRKQEVLKLPHEVPSSVGLTSGSVSIRPNPARTTTNFLH
jgi:hypothetical protein